MSDSPAELRRRIAELEAALEQPDLLDVVRETLHEKLQALRARLAELAEGVRLGDSTGSELRPPPAAGGPHGEVDVQGNARIYGPTVGTNLGQIIYHAVPSDEQREHLVRYLHRVSAKLGRLRLRGLSALDDKGLQLPNVYVMPSIDLPSVCRRASYAGSALSRVTTACGAQRP